MYGVKQPWLNIIQWDYHREVGGLILGKRMGDKYKIEKLIQLKNRIRLSRHKYKLPNVFVLFAVMIWQKVKYGHDILGEWHSHPNIGDVAEPSEKDELVMRRKVRWSGVQFYLLGIVIKTVKKKTLMNLWYYSLNNINEKRYSNPVRQARKGK